MWYVSVKISIYRPNELKFVANFQIIKATGNWNFLYQIPQNAKRERKRLLKKNVYLLHKRAEDFQKRLKAKLCLVNKAITQSLGKTEKKIKQNIWHTYNKKYCVKTLHLETNH